VISITITNANFHVRGTTDIATGFDIIERTDTGITTALSHSRRLV
jgi:hypothetical protein